MSIYNIKGQLVRTLVNEPMNVGNYTLVWDGRAHESKIVPSGLYISRLQVDGLVEQKKMC